MPKQQRRTFTTEFKAQINPQGYHIKSDALWDFVIQAFLFVICVYRCFFPLFYAGKQAVKFIGRCIVGLLSQQ